MVSKMKKIKILVIEDDDNVRKNIVTLLEEENYNVFSANGGRTGIEMAKKEIPDLIISDILMPEIDGYRVLEELSKNKALSTIPFIFLTAKVEREDIRKGMQLGADDYLFKPFKSEELLSAIISRLKKREVIKMGHLTKTTKVKNEKVKKYGEDDKIFLNMNGKPNYIQINGIIYITAENQYTSISLVGGDRILVRKSISWWEDSLPSKKFIRIHRSTIINSDFIVKMERWYNSSFLFYLKDVKEPFVISKRFSSKLRKNQI
jgi:CheY-like chemotaxis protein